MKIKPIRVSLDHPKDCVEMSIEGTNDSWGNEKLNITPIYEATATLYDEDNIARKKLTVRLEGDDYIKWDGSNKEIIQLFLDKYDWLEIIN